MLWLGNEACMIILPSIHSQVMHTLISSILLFPDRKTAFSPVKSLQLATADFYHTFVTKIYHRLIVLIYTIVYSMYSIKSNYSCCSDVVSCCQPVWMAPLTSFTFLLLHIQDCFIFSAFFFW